jgi:hypothetical protein
MHVVCGAVEECVRHLFGCTSVHDLDLFPVDTIPLEGVLQHHKGLKTVVGKQCLALEVLPL